MRHGENGRPRAPVPARVGSPRPGAGYTGLSPGTVDLGRAAAR